MKHLKLEITCIKLIYAFRMDVTKTYNKTMVLDTVVVIIIASPSEFSGTIATPKAVSISEFSLYVSKED